MCMCENCEGMGFNLWMNNLKPKFLRCLVCQGKGTLTNVFGAIGISGLNSDIVLTKRSNKWIRP